MALNVGGLGTHKGGTQWIATVWFNECLIRFCIRFCVKREARKASGLISEVSVSQFKMHAVSCSRTFFFVISPCSPFPI